MSRAKTKDELLRSACDEFAKLSDLVNSMTESERESEFNFSDFPGLKEAHWQRDKVLKDVFVHLYEWHQLLLNWVEANLAGDTQPFLPAPYNWRTCAQLNLEFRERHQERLLDEAFRMLSDSHQVVITLIEGFSNEELFTGRHYSWTGTTSLGSYCVSATSSHYIWAARKVRMHLRRLRASR